MNIEEKIKQHIAENILFSDNGYEFPDDASLMEEDIIDSLGTLELAMFIEEAFGFRVDQQDLTPDNFDSVTSLAAFIRRQLQTTVPT
jgi:acyl carrier protein